ncbi:metal-dependent phosphohydrolase [Marinitoga sp. 38H-ov]|nr:metal-dependent phosphohydrolase [Marinitoga sp. 38H-ov]
MIRALITFLEQHDEYTKNHSRNVADLAVNIAEEMNLDKSYIRKIYLAGLLHDIGKLLIPLEILNKNGPLTDNEYDIIKKHPIIGYNALIKTESLKEIAIGIKHHHERYDGKGYPDGLKGSGIPLMSQIISVVDAWDAMMTKRAYRDPLGKEKAIKEIVNNSGKQFSPEVVKAFIKIIQE